MIIYRLYNALSGKAYIGQTLQTIAARCNLHRKAAKRGVKTAIGAAIRKYGWEAFAVEVLEVCDSQPAMDAAEIRWIETMKTMAPHGYNLRSGGGESYKYTEGFRASLRGPRGAMHTDEFKRRRSRELKGVPRDPETVERIKASHRAKSDMTFERAEQIRKWRVDNKATYIQTADHFRLPQSQVNKILSYAAWK